VALRRPTIRATCFSRQADLRRVRRPRVFNSAAIPRSVHTKNQTRRKLSDGN